MPMEINRKELKRQARSAIGEARPRFWVVALVYLLLTTGVGYLPMLIPGGSAPGLHAPALFLLLLALLLQQVMDFGLDLWALWTNRRLEPGLGALFQGFSVVGRLLLMRLLILLRVLGWAMLLSCLAALFVLFSPTAVLLLIPIVAVALNAIMLRYALAPYLLADHPDDGAGAAVRRSAELTQGWVWELFKLDLSFLGWVLLAALLSGLASSLFLWRSGFFQALAAIPPMELPDLISGYQMWQSGLTLDALSFTEQQLQLYALYDSVSGSIWTMLCSDLLPLPLLLWLVPYRAAASAGFYDARLRLQRDSAPPL